jgi:hypothetical protein
MAILVPEDSGAGVAAAPSQSNQCPERQYAGLSVRSILQCAESPAGLRKKIHQWTTVLVVRGAR